MVRVIEQKRCRGVFRSGALGKSLGLSVLAEKWENGSLAARSAIYRVTVHIAAQKLEQADNSARGQPEGAEHEKTRRSGFIGKAWSGR